ncbi:hypothetical protein LZT70_03045 [Staphylococcus epidermidis]|uniref:hypothetical protein n=1 Tax=Staphylococcus epidermidis TaxID=1282 RepID=UPI0020950CA6|nr:hypothetical protein [Staphylococcus epidermidis]MCO6217280.1 hypothetical protein [Staphylococcus epidermidis]
MKYLLGYITMLGTMGITLLCGAGFTTVIGASLLAFIFSVFIWEAWLKAIKKTETCANK